MVAANAWAVPSVDLYIIDTEGDDTIFNGSTQKLRITVSVSDSEAAPATTTYYYKVTIDNENIKIAPTDDGDLPSIDVGDTEIVDRQWSSNLLLEGSHTMRVEIFTDMKGTTRPADQPVSDTETFTIDKTAPDISIGTETDAFSPNRDRILDDVAVFYSINEDVAESLLQFRRKTGADDREGVPIGDQDDLRANSGNYTYLWDGGDRNRIFEDGEYILRFHVVDKAGNTAEKFSTAVTIDTVAPTISQIFANENLPLLDGGFINIPIQSIKVTANPGDGMPLNLTAQETELTVERRGNVNVDGSVNAEGMSLTFTFGNRLDGASENGRYTASIAVADRVGNVAERTLNFTFDNIAPNLTEINTPNGELTPGGGVSEWMNFVEVTLNDNIQDGLNLSDSTIRLTGPNGAVLGRQTQPAANKIRLDIPIAALGTRWSHGRCVYN